MGAKELKIEAPEGYEVDWDNSSMNTIRFKPIKKKITYQDIINNIKAKNIGVNVQFGLTKIGTDCFITSEKQLEQLLALNKLMNVAKYLNGDWEPNWNDEFEDKIYFYYSYGKLNICAKRYSNFGCVCFKTIDLAHQAVEILGKEEVKKALGIFE
jgi:hypothetical protein